MGTFAAGYFLDPHTGRPVAAQTVQVVEYPTDVPVTPDGGVVATGATGGYGRFTVADVDAVTLVGSSGARVDLVSIEKQLAGIVTYTKAEIDALVAQGGTSGTVNLVAGDGISITHDPGANTWTISRSESGGGGEAGDITVTDHGDGTVTFSGETVTDHGDGTFTIDDLAVIDNGNNTFTITYV